jgi:hypothetical protein
LKDAAYVVLITGFLAVDMGNHPLLAWINTIFYCHWLIKQYTLVQNKKGPV